MSDVQDQAKERVDKAARINAEVNARLRPAEKPQPKVLKGKADG